ncbi:MAG: hypothetical protein SPI87_00925 [Anaerobutyricum sp.]|nr:hypothetical protein [Eubacterium sp.]MDY6045576.1 hypothetical protein [Anaerobutyricum sp.]
MGIIEKNGIFIQNSNLKDRFTVLNDQLKRHLSTECIYLADKKDDLENQILQLKIEKEQKDKTLFQNVEKKDVRKFFSPLNLKEIEKDQKDEKQKHLTMEMERIQQEIAQFDNRMNEIKELIHDLDILVQDPLLIESIEERDSEQKMDAMAPIIDDTVLDDLLMDEEKSNVASSHDDEKEKVISIKYYPQLLRSIYDLSDVLQSKYNNLEILIEFNDHNLELNPDINQNLLEQVRDNIERAVEDYQITMILIQGNVTEEIIDLSISYMSENELIDTMKISYLVQLNQ